jgi:hypothetical protein
MDLIIPIKSKLIQNEIFFLELTDWPVVYISELLLLIKKFLIKLLIPGIMHGFVITILLLKKECIY